MGESSFSIPLEISIYFVAAPGAEGGRRGPKGGGKSKTSSSKLGFIAQPVYSLGAEANP